MKKAKVIVIAIALMLVAGLALMVNRQSPATAQPIIRPVTEPEFQPAQEVKTVAVNASVHDRSGYWVLVNQAASVRRFPSGPDVRQGFRLRPGQYFHLDPKGGNASWAMGFACPNGGRYCNSRENLQGFILRHTLGGRVSTHATDDLKEATVLLASLKKAGNGDALQAGALYVPTMLSGHTATLSPVSVTVDSERRTCSRDLWLRNDRLHPIGLLHQGDRFVVERYTNGSGNKYEVWAIGRAYGPGVNPQGKRGRVLAKYLC